MKNLIAIIVALVLACPGAAQSEYGGGWAVPSLDTMSSINSEIMQESIMRHRAGLPQAGSTRTAPSRKAAPLSLYGSALAQTPGGSSRPVALDTSFVRSKALQKKSQEAILAAVRKRQPAAVAEYANFFEKFDIVTLFARATSDYGFRSNDVADTMAAYWLVAWVIANNGSEPSPAAARAVRDQVKLGIARTEVANFSPARRHQLADEAIFNMILLIELYDYTQKGKMSRADFARAGDATQRAFLGFGADLRNLKLTTAGFQKR